MNIQYWLFLCEVQSGAHDHSYHKDEREDRKIAHITLMPNDVADLEPALAKLVAILPNKVGLDKKGDK